MMKDYVGAIGDDQLYKVKNHGFGIINLQHSYEKGSHWVAFAVVKHYLLVFDPFGVVPDTPLMEYASKKALVLQFNQVQILPTDSTSCGLYCLLFIKELPKIYASKQPIFVFRKFIESFNFTNLALNEQCVQHTFT